jgi:hypothetical protein
VGKNKVDLPISLRNPNPMMIKTWTSTGWATLPNGAQPVTVEIETELVRSLISELNGFYNVGLCTDPIFDRHCEHVSRVVKPPILMIGASHVIKEADILSDRGYQVTICGRPGWRAVSGAINELAGKVKEAMADLPPETIFVVQCLDNTVYLGRT